MLQDHPEGIVLSIRVQPGAKRSAIVGVHGDALKVAVTAPPEDGRANDAVLTLLREEFDLPRSQLVLLSGQTNRNQVVLVRGVSAEELRKLIRTNKIKDAKTLIGFLYWDKL